MTVARQVRLTLFVIVSLVVAAFPAVAQTPDTPADAPPVVSPPSIYWGVRFGPSFGSLTNVETFDSTAVGASFEPTLNFGGFVNIDLAGPLSLQPEVLFVVRGERIHAASAQPIVTGTGTKPARADRVVLLRYLEMPLLIRASKPMRPSTSVFVIAGPALAFRRSAVVRQVDDPGQFVDIDALVSGGNFSIVYGGGLQHERWIVDARFTRGLRNIAVAPNVPAVKTNAFTVLLGVRI